MAISVDILGGTRYKIDRKKIRETVEKTLKSHGVADMAEVSVVVVGERKMSQLHLKYLQAEGPTDVMSWPLEGVNYPDDVLRLGDVVVCYPVAVKLAAEENMMVDEKIASLVEHGCLHLLGIHHE